MSLQNLLKAGQLKTHPPNATEIERLLAAAQRNLRDAQVTTISAETRFDAVYKAIMQSARAAMMMYGYRPDTNRPGYHMTVVQSLPLTIGLESARVAVLDVLCRQRNVASSLVAACQQIADRKNDAKISAKCRENHVTM